MNRKFFSFPRILGWALAFLLGAFPLAAQSWEELTQQLAAFSSDHAAQFSRKTLNVNTVRLGGLQPEDAAQWNQFELVEKSKKPNKLGNAVKFSVTLTALHYDNLDDRDWAIKNWLKQFMGPASIRPGRNTKSVPDAPPGIVVIGERSIVLLTLPCAQYDAQTYREWRTKMAKYFSTETSVILELDGCEGPLNWTKNAPDPTDRRWK